MQARTLMIYEELTPEVEPKFIRPRTDDCLTEEEKDILNKLSNDYTLNARQVLERIKGPFEVGAIPKFQEVSANSRPSQQTSCFTDGGVDCPTISWASIPGIGVWWPNSSGAMGGHAFGTDEDDQLRLIEIRRHSEFLRTKATDYGVQQWNTLPGQMCSSTRAEIAAVCGALTDPEPVHIGIDNKGALINVTKLITIAATW